MIGVTRDTPEVRLGIALAALVWLLPACTTSRSTRLTGGDVTVVTTEMAAALASSEWLAERGPDSLPMAIVINRVRNLTTDVIPIPEQWLFVARVANSLPIQELRRTKNIRMVIAPERRDALRDMGYEVDDPTGAEPTHVMTATFLSIRRSGRSGQSEVTNLRTDLYAMEYSVTDLVSRDIVWTGRFEFKREARGALID